MDQGTGSGTSSGSGVAGNQKFCLRWNDYSSSMVTSFRHLREERSFTDVTISVDGESLKAHKMVLSACSPYFKKLLEETPSKHPIIILKDIKMKEMEAILDFIYTGEVNIAQEDLQSFLKVAMRLKVKGLAEGNIPAGQIGPIGNSGASVVGETSSGKGVKNEQSVAAATSTS